MNKPILILVCGCSAVGKTTFCKRLAQARGYKYLSADDFYKKLNGDDRIRANKFQVWAALFEAIEDCYECNVNCVVDSNSLYSASRDELINWFPGFEHHLIYIESDIGLRLHNNTQRDRQVPTDAMYQMMVNVEPPVWNTLDKRWLSLIRLVNENNKLHIIGQYGNVILSEGEIQC